MERYVLNMGDLTSEHRSFALGTSLQQSSIGSVQPDHEFQVHKYSSNDNNGNTVDNQSHIVRTVSSQSSIITYSGSDATCPVPTEPTSPTVPTLPTVPIAPTVVTAPT
jgi:hypothetical protein